jgi:hypothetical protein
MTFDTLGRFETRIDLNSSVLDVYRVNRHELSRTDLVRFGHSDFRTHHYFVHEWFNGSTDCQAGAHLEWRVVDLVHRATTPGKDGHDRVIHEIRREAEVVLTPAANDSVCFRETWSNVSKGVMPQMELEPFVDLVRKVSSRLETSMR